jgi:hypothetical protein
MIDQYHAAEHPEPACPEPAEGSRGRRKTRLSEELLQKRHWFGIWLDKGVGRGKHDVRAYQDSTERIAER